MKSGHYDLLRVTTIEVVECPQKTCGVLISGIPQTDAKGAVYVCPFCRHEFEPRKAVMRDVHILGDRDGRSH